MRLFVVNGILRRPRGLLAHEIASYCYRVTAETENEARGCGMLAFMESDRCNGWTIATMHADDVTDFVMTFARVELAGERA